MDSNNPVSKTPKFLYRFTSKHKKKQLKMLAAINSSSMTHELSIALDAHLEANMKKIESKIPPPLP